MASVRRLKKDVDYLASAIVQDCFNAIIYGADDAQVGEILQTAIEAANMFKIRISSGKNVAKAEKAAYYKCIAKDLILSVDDSFSNLSALVKG